nr:hypothetical protein CFP56_02812 [Quercus suber]
MSSTLCEFPGGICVTACDRDWIQRGSTEDWKARGKNVSTLPPGTMHMSGDCSMSHITVQHWEFKMLDKAAISQRLTDERSALQHSIGNSAENIWTFVRLAYRLYLCCFAWLPRTFRQLFKDDRTQYEDN